jgi:NAD(P)-dependent dehydrogenase (short-subunit alcohol dehydrogenase family)
MKLKNKTAVVTGSGRGIGKAIALAFAREGARLVVTARTESQLEEVRKEAEAAGADVLTIRTDISKFPDVENLVMRTLERFGPPDILVNNASISKRALTVDYDDDVWREVIGINLVGTYLVTKYFLKTMLPGKSGRIISIASVSGKVGQPMGSAYSASKHGVLGLTKSLALEMKIMGTPKITVNAICPGAIRTEMMEGEGGLLEFISGAEGLSREEALTYITEKNVQGRLLDPEEIAAMAVFLASNEAKGITGQAFNVCAGQVMF